jgi:NAD(P)-dependent dehydrogenase (short-subunit alcohol dehydrogenase family)
MQLKDKVFLVTGGASGLGRACAELFVAQGARVVIVDYNAETGAAAAKALGQGARFAQANVVSEEDVQKAVDLALSEFGALHGAVCCAGIGTAEKVVSKEGKPHSLKGFAKTIEVNLVGTFNVIRLAAAAIAAKKAEPGAEAGVFIVTASIAAFEGQLGQTAYAASKGGIVAMVLPMARELAPLGMRVMAIAPGIFDTPILAGLSENVRASLGQQVPFPSRLGDPREFAQLAGQIVENPMLNGTVIRLDGALRMAAR